MKKKKHTHTKIPHQPKYFIFLNQQAELNHFLEVLLWKVSTDAIWKSALGSHQTLRFRIASWA